MTQDPQHAPWDRPDRSDERDQRDQRDQHGGGHGSATGGGQQHPAEQSWSDPQPPTAQQPVEPAAASGPPSYGPPSYEQPSYGQGAPAQPSHQQPSYGQPGGYAGGPAQPPAGYGYGYGGVPAGQGPPAPVSTIVLLVLSGIATLVTIGALVGAVYIAPVVLAIMALNRNRLDPDGARRLTRTGWIIFAVATGLFALLVILLVGVFAAGLFGGFSSYDGSYGSSV